ncbi:hypothetical protein Syun_003078 [Stephania yunnanensis]|uniref:Kinesin-like protein n=1 Tax=Stephania yunnanensis TaxID=152371 RepID=A0AAP0Q3I5_9MAGN
MAFRNQNKPPIPSLNHRSPRKKKEIGISDTQKFGKRRKIDGEKMAGQSNIGCARQAFSAVNGGGQDQSSRGDLGTNGESECGPIEYTKEEVEALLNEKMKGKTKFDYKGRCEQMMEYIKKSRPCIRWHMVELRKLRDLLESSFRKYSELEVLLKTTKEVHETKEAESGKKIVFLEEKLAKVESEKTIAESTTSEMRTQLEVQKELVRDLRLRQAELESINVEKEEERKKLLNIILELKGNIRVFCRVRPLFSDDGTGAGNPYISYPTSTESLGRGIDLIQNGQKHQFTFDKVFTPESSQQDVFVEISQLVQSALDGYKVCIFAYGQTGSGKTYTMLGSSDALERKGLIPRSLEQIFESSRSLLSQGWKYKMQASMLEIYNETIRDLLSTNWAGATEKGAAAKQYTIKHEANGNTHVSDLTVVDVCSIQEVSYLLRQAAQSRSVGRTQMNEQSSRSHFVFTLRISGVNESTEQQVHGVLNLIDLAGSERLSKSGSTGDRLRETQAINKSLSSLSDVIFALAKKEDHVPFRNSKLTYLLQPCLGGNSKTLMFVNISPDPSSMGESLCSLRFAARVNACEIGVPRRQTSMRTADSRLSYR